MRLTLVPLLLLLNSDGQVIALLPVDLVTLRVIIDEVTAVARFGLVEVCFGDGLIGEVLVLSELEDKSESRLVQVFHADVGQVLQGTFVTVGDHLGE